MVAFYSGDYEENREACFLIKHAVLYVEEPTFEYKSNSQINQTSLPNPWYINQTRFPGYRWSNPSIPSGIPVEGLLGMPPLQELHLWVLRFLNCFQPNY